MVSVAVEKEWRIDEQTNPSYVAKHKPTFKKRARFLCGLFSPNLSLQTEYLRNKTFIKMQFTTIFVTALMALGVSAQVCRGLGSKCAASYLRHIFSLFSQAPLPPILCKSNCLLTLSKDCCGGAGDTSCCAQPNLYCKADANEHGCYHICAYVNKRSALFLTASLILILYSEKPTALEA